MFGWAAAPKPDVASPNEVRAPNHAPLDQDDRTVTVREELGRMRMNIMLGRPLSERTPGERISQVESREHSSWAEVKSSKFARPTAQLRHNAPVPDPVAARRRSKRINGMPARAIEGLVP